MTTDLLVVNPSAKMDMYKNLSSFSALEPPLFAALLASYVRKDGYSVKILDAEVEDLPPNETAARIIECSPRLTAIVVMGINPSASSTPKMPATRRIVHEVKEKDPSAKIILGGIHPAALPEKTLKETEADFIYQGEGYRTITELLNELERGSEDNFKTRGLWYKNSNNKITANAPAPLVENLDSLPLAAWDLLPMEKYRAHNWHCFEDLDHRSPYGVIYTSLGCPFNCSYCNIKTLYNGKPGIRFRSPEKVLEEIDLLVEKYKIKNIKFFDELFTLKQTHVTDICDRITKNDYDLNIWAYARVDTINESILERMKKAGIKWLAYGFESANVNVRKGVSKNFEQSQFERAIDLTRKKGVYIIGNFIFGLPDDNKDTMRETLELAKKYNFEYVNFYTAMAYPGSELYNESLKKGIKLSDNWLEYSQYGYETVPLPTKYLTSKEVLEFRDKAFKEYFSNPKYIDMIREKFGEKVVEHINTMLTYNIRRKILEG